MARFEVRAKVDGAERFADRLDDVYDRVVDRTQEELKSAARVLHRAAEAFAPVDSGAYRNSLRSKVEGKRAQVWTRSPYAGVVEFARTYTRSPLGVETHEVEWGTGLASPPRVVYRALDNNVRGITDSFFDAMIDEFEADGWLED